MNKIDCKALSSNLMATLKEKITTGTSAGYPKPTLVIIKLGHNLDDSAYQEMIIKKSKSIGIYCSVYKLNKVKEVCGLLKLIQNYLDVHGIIILGLSQVSKDELKQVSGLIPPDKDLDGLSYVNAGKSLVYNEGFIPCTAESNLRILQSLPISLEGLKVTIIGRSVRVGKPSAVLMLAENATVKICHSKTKNLGEELKDADIIISAVGKPGLIQPEMIKQGVILIDDGINVNSECHLCGDISTECYEKSSYYTTVPGGVGVMTNSILLEHLIQNWEHANELIDEGLQTKTIYNTEEK